MLLKFNLIICLVLCSVTFTSAQSLIDTTARKAPILIEQDNNKVKLSADTPPLQQISGAPNAFYTYFWEFGDGNYSREENPEHVYEEKGEYEVRLQVTNNYDNGKPPPSRPKKVNVGSKTSSEPTASAGDNLNSFDLLKSREPVPEEEMVVVMHYENALTYPTKGKLYLYYNERRFKADNFSLVDIRTHHGEQRLQEETLLSGLFNHTVPNQQWASLSPTNNKVWYWPVDSSKREHLYITIDESEQHYRDKLILEFKDLAPGAKRNVFFSIKTTPEMIQDTSAIIKMRGVFVPDERSESHQVKDLEMEIVTSHDPNKMAVNDTRINYRLRKSKKIKYKVRFQNNGEGPASTIKLNVDMPGIIDKSTLEVLDMYPKCPICPDNIPVSYSCLDTVLMKDKVSFIFKNIYLPGSNQKGVEAYDSTKGFVKYGVKLDKKAPKINSASRTAIIFDKNDPILTNYAKTYFKPGLSLGVMGGYAEVRGLQNSKDYFFGVTVSPYMPYRGYFQAELMAGIGSYEEFSHLESRQPFGPGIDLMELEVIDEQRNYKYLNLTIVPVSYRYNINRFVGFGAGIQVSTKLYENVKGTQDLQYFIESPNGVLEPDQTKSRTVEINESENITRINPGAFIDLNLGKVRIGPLAGFRYVYQLHSPKHLWMFYLNWKI